MVGEAVKVTLEWYEQQIAAICGVLRTCECQRETRKSSREMPDMEKVITDILGACGEIAVAKALNRYWCPGINTFSDVPDVGKNIEVKSTPRPDGNLLIQYDDPEERIYVLVRGSLPTLELVGYITGRAAKQKQWWMNPGKGWCYVVPATELRAFPAPRPGDTGTTNGSTQPTGTSSSGSVPADE
jgi:hypothetical protein